MLIRRRMERLACSGSALLGHEGFQDRDRGEVMERVEAMIPPYISRTAWINLLLEQALAEAEQKWEAKGRA